MGDFFFLYSSSFVRIINIISRISFLHTSLFFNPCFFSFIAKLRPLVHSSTMTSMIPVSITQQVPFVQTTVSPVQAEIQPAEGGSFEDPQKGRTTDVCRHWARGFCNRGVSCGFSHTGPTPSGEPRSTGADAEQIAYNKSHVSCKDFSAGKCNRGERCKFAHIGAGPKRGTPSCRDWAAGTCTRGDMCKYKHEAACVMGGSCNSLGTPPLARNGSGVSISSSIVSSEGMYSASNSFRQMPHYPMQPQMNKALAAVPAPDAYVASSQPSTPSDSPAYCTQSVDATPQAWPVQQIPQIVSTPVMGPLVVQMPQPQVQTYVAPYQPAPLQPATEMTLPARVEKPAELSNAVMMFQTPPTVCTHLQGGVVLL